MQEEQARIDELESQIAQLAASNGQLEADVKDLEEEIAENQKAVASAKQVPKALDRVSSERQRAPLMMCTCIQRASASAVECYAKRLKDHR